MHHFHIPPFVFHVAQWLVATGLACIFPSPCMRACGWHLDVIPAWARRWSFCILRALQELPWSRIHEGPFRLPCFSSQHIRCRCWATLQLLVHPVKIHPSQWLQFRRLPISSNCLRSSDILCDSPCMCSFGNHSDENLCTRRTSVRNLRSLRPNAHPHLSGAPGWILLVGYLTMLFSGLNPSYGSFLQWCLPIQLEHLLCLQHECWEWFEDVLCIVWWSRCQIRCSSHGHTLHSGHVLYHDPWHNVRRPSVASVTFQAWPKWLPCLHLLSNRKARVHTHRSVSRISHWWSAWCPFLSIFLRTPRRWIQSMIGTQETGRLSECWQKLEEVLLDWSLWWFPPTWRWSLHSAPTCDFVLWTVMRMRSKCESSHLWMLQYWFVGKLVHSLLISRIPRASPGIHREVGTPWWMRDPCCWVQPQCHWQFSS